MAQNQVKRKILIVDDELAVRQSLQLLLKSSFQVQTAANGQSALETIKSFSPDLIFLDLFLPDIDGIETLKQLRCFNAEVPVVMLTGSSSVNDAVAAMKLGARDYLSKPFNIDALTSLILEILADAPAIESSKSNPVAKPLKVIGDYGRIVGQSAAMQDIYYQVDRVAPHNASVLINGESGTGKELVAREIHNQSNRKDQPFYAINCAAIPENLIESELFGSEKGAYTGATQQRLGLFEQANGGTVFLDEIGELQMSVQVKLLRFLQEQEFYRVGGTKLIKVDVRIVCATNRNLENMILEKKFRQDLFYRINVINLTLPPLRERGTDLIRLVEYFQTKFSHKYNQKNLSFADSAWKILQNYTWPGNVRELENFMESLYALMPDGVISADELPPRVRNHPERLKPESDVVDLGEAERQFETEMIIKALRSTNYVQTKAASVLGITRRMLKYKMDKLGISNEH